MQLEVESAGVAEAASLLVASPEGRVGRPAVYALGLCVSAGSGWRLLDFDLENAVLQRPGSFVLSK